MLRRLGPTEDIIDLRDAVELLFEYADGEPDDDDPDYDEYKQAQAIREAMVNDIGIGDDLGSFHDYAENEPTAISESYFKEYAQELAEDIGAIDQDMQWPRSYIDWDAAADALKQDYSSFTYDGVTFYVRSY